MNGLVQWFNKSEHNRCFMATCDLLTFTEELCHGKLYVPYFPLFYTLDLLINWLLDLLLIYTLAKSPKVFRGLIETADFQRKSIFFKTFVKFLDTSFLKAIWNFDYWYNCHYDYRYRLCDTRVLKYLHICMSSILEADEAKNKRFG